MTRYSITRQLPMIAALVAVVLATAIHPVSAAEKTRSRGPQLEFQGNRLRQQERSSATAVVTTQSAEQPIPKVAPARTAAGAPLRGFRRAPTPTRTKAPGELTLRANRGDAKVHGSSPPSVTGLSVTGLSVTGLSVTGPLHFSRKRAVAKPSAPTKLIVPGSRQNAARIVANSEPAETETVVQAEPAQHMIAADATTAARRAFDEQTTSPALGEHPAEALEPVGSEDEYGFSTLAADGPIAEDRAGEPQPPTYSAPEVLTTVSRPSADPAVTTPMNRGPMNQGPITVATRPARRSNFVASGVTFSGRGNRNTNYSSGSQQSIHDGAVYSHGRVATIDTGTMPTSPMFGGQYAFSPRQMFGEAIGEPADAKTTAWPNRAAAQAHLASTASGAVNYELAGTVYGGPAATCTACDAGSSACSDCGQRSGCCTCPQAYWQAGFQAQVLRRSTASSRGALVSCDCIYQQSFNASDADQIWGAGYRFNLRRVDHCGHDYQIIYSNNQDWLYDNLFAGGLNVLGVNIGTGSSRVRYLSTLQSAEANVLMAWDNWTNVLVGFRWFELDEHASISANGTNATFATSYDTLNDLIGGQVGIERAVFDRGDPLTLLVTGKTGVYANRIVRTATGIAAANATTNEVSFSGDLEILARYQFNPHVAFTAGYNLLWLETTALAIEQYGSSKTAINTSGSPFYHGFLLGVEAVW